MCTNATEKLITARRAKKKKKGFLVVSTENKALVVRMDCQDASQKSLGNAESRV